MQVETKCGWSAVALAAVLMMTGTWAATLGQEKTAEDPALIRTRKQVQILDDIYKSAIVLITENYVQENSDLAAGAAFQKLFDVVRKKGYHDVRLLDATGEPYEKKNLPQDDYEKARSLL